MRMSIPETGMHFYILRCKQRARPLDSQGYSVLSDKNLDARRNHSAFYSVEVVGDRNSAPFLKVADG
jgi:hypothetical protein